MMIKITKQFQNDLEEIQNIFKNYFKKEYKSGEYHINIQICTDKNSWDIKINNGEGEGEGEERKRMLVRNIAVLKRNSVKVEYQVITTKPFNTLEIKEEEMIYDIDNEHFNKVEYIKPIKDFVIPNNLNFKDVLSKIISCQDNGLCNAFFEFMKLNELLEENKGYIKLDKKLKSIFDLGDGIEKLDSCLLEANYGKLYEKAMERVFNSEKSILKETLDKLSVWRKFRLKINRDTKNEKIKRV